MDEAAFITNQAVTGAFGPVWAQASKQGGVDMGFSAMEGLVGAHEALQVVSLNFYRFGLGAQNGHG